MTEGGFSRRDLFRRLGARTPVIQPLGSPCRMCPDTPCITVCEPRALRKEQSLRMTEARIQPWACIAHQGTFCTACREQCPVPGAIEVEAGRPRIIESICTGCGVCQQVCPAPENAVLLMRLRGRAQSDAAGAAAGAR
jgi:Pyruvate/2-oxoacid:ferredoxin oxidoreductase delta subunit